MEHERVHEAEQLPRKVLRQLRDERQPQPALSTSLGNSGDLLEQRFHFLETLFAEKLVGFFDDDQHVGRF